MKRPTDAITKEVTALASMSLKQLRSEWDRRYGAPPKHRAADLLRRVLAWRIQADAYGGFDAATQRMLEHDASNVRATAEPGMCLAREWAGRRHEVTVLDKCIEYKGQKYGSLSEVARLITGKRWNGPRFFGLRQENVR